MTAAQPLSLGSFQRGAAAVWVTWPARPWGPSPEGKPYFGFFRILSISLDFWVSFKFVWVLLSIRLGSTTLKFGFFWVLLSISLGPFQWLVLGSLSMTCPWVPFNFFGSLSTPNPNPNPNPNALPGGGFRDRVWWFGFPFKFFWVCVWVHFGSAFGFFLGLRLGSFWVLVWVPFGFLLGSLSISLDVWVSFNYVWVLVWVLFGFLLGSVWVPFQTL